jgi:hypothetical protein
MSELLLQMLIPALILSGGAIACLALVPSTPPQLRFMIAVVGLGVWIVPWPWIDVSLELPGLASLPIAQADTINRIISAAAQVKSNGYPAAADARGYVAYAVIALFSIGFVWFVADCIRLHASIKGWNKRSRCGASLRALLPADLQSTRARIRIVPGTRVAAASGWISPTIWIGDGFGSEQDLRLALIHECWHVRRFDQVCIVLIMAVRRAYWWNPIVAYLARQSVLMMESACDRRCMQSLGRRHYVERLASMMLNAEPCQSAHLVAAARSSSHNVYRLRLLDRQVQVRARDCAAIVLLSTVGALAAGCRITEVGSTHAAWSRVAVPATPAGRALTALLKGFHGGDLESVGVYLGAYTPQEVQLQLYDWADGFELVDILSSERLSVEYIVQNNINGAKRVGELEVADTESIYVSASKLRDFAER